MIFHINDSRGLFIFRPQKNNVSLSVWLKNSNTVQTALVLDTALLDFIVCFVLFGFYQAKQDCVGPGTLIKRKCWSLFLKKKNKMNSRTRGFVFLVKFITEVKFS